MIRVDRKLNSTDVVDALTDLFILRGAPEYIRSDNGPEFIAKKVLDWITAVGSKTAYIEPGSPWEGVTVTTDVTAYTSDISGAASAVAAAINAEGVPASIGIQCQGRH